MLQPPPYAGPGFTPPPYASGSYVLRPALPAGGGFMSNSAGTSQSGGTPSHLLPPPPAAAALTHASGAGGVDGGGVDGNESGGGISELQMISTRRGVGDGAGPYPGSIGGGSAIVARALMERHHSSPGGAPPRGGAGGGGMPTSSSIDSSSSSDPQQRQPDAAAAAGSSSSPAGGGVGRDVSSDADPAVVLPLPHPVLAKFRSMNARSRLSSSTAQNNSLDGSPASTPRRGSLDQGSASDSAASSSRHGMPDPEGRAPIPPPGDLMDPCGSSGPASSVDSPSGGDGGGGGGSVGEQPQGGFDSAAPALPRRMSRWASTGAVREPPSVMMGGGGSGVQDNGTASSGALPAVGTVAASTNPLYCDILRSEISVDQLSIDISDSQIGE